jgi:hypothetical protein
MAELLKICKKISSLYLFFGISTNKVSLAVDLNNKKQFCTTTKSCRKYSYQALENEKDKR